MTPGESSYQEIEAFWDSVARQERDSDGLRPTARDPHLQDLVEATMERWLRPHDRLLDIGCGDGTSTLKFARSTESALGVDYIGEFIARARSQAEVQKSNNASFEVANILDLSSIRARHQLFDVAVTIRCIINLDTFEKQTQALSEIASCVKAGGLYLAGEGWADGINSLNLVRRRAGLPAIEVVKYNLLLDRAQFEREAARYFEFVDYVGLGFYLLLSRVIQPLLTAPAPPSHTHPLNQVAAHVEKAARLGRYFDACDFAGVYVYRRKMN